MKQNIKLSTVVDLANIDSPISYGDKIISLGSCFSDNIGKYLYDLGYNILVNPFGTQYNPLSIAEVLYILIGEKDFSDDNIVFHNQLYHSFMHHGKFSHKDYDCFIENISSTISFAKEFFISVKYIMITWGTSFVYRLRDTGRVVANCHKIPDNNFIRSLELSDSLLDTWKCLLDKVFQINPEVKIITTVSPIRHLRDKAHGNQISKSNLILFDYLLRQEYSDRIFYFDAYEIMMDELRDYRYYDRDMCHPSSLAVDIIKDRFTSSVLNQKEQNIRDAMNNFRLQLSHRPINMDEFEQDLYRDRLNLQIAKFREQFPLVNVDNIITNNN